MDESGFVEEAAMKANLKNALMIVAALLVAYISAFFVTMEVVKSPYRNLDLPHAHRTRIHVPRWVAFPGRFLGHWTVKFFAPLIWVEHQILPPEYWEWNEGQPVPDWVK